MVNRIQRDPKTGLYYKDGKGYKYLKGSRKQVYTFQNALYTKGGLTRKQLIMNKSGYIVSKKKSEFEKTFKRLRKAGYCAAKGKFGCVRLADDKKGKCRSLSQHVKEYKNRTRKNRK